MLVSPIGFKCLVREGISGKSVEFCEKTCKSLCRDVEPSFDASEDYTHFATITKGTNSRYNTPENPGLPLCIDKVM